LTAKRAFTTSHTGKRRSSLVFFQRFQQYSKNSKPNVAEKGQKINEQKNPSLKKQKPKNPVRNTLIVLLSISSDN